MQPLNSIAMIPSNGTIAHMRKILAQNNEDYLPVYHRSHTNIIGIVSVRELLTIPEDQPVSSYAYSPWFLTKNIKITDILQQFRHNRQNMAVVLDDNGNAIGILSLEDVLDEIFGERATDLSTHQTPHQYLIERSFPGEMKISDFDKQFRTQLRNYGVDTIGQLFYKILDHLPQKGESIQIERFEFTVKETSPLGIKKISVKTIL
jgi:CBS domain containing-hemolysin-like protein